MSYLTFKKIHKGQIRIYKPIINGVDIKPPSGQTPCI